MVATFLESLPNLTCFSEIYDNLARGKSSGIVYEGYTSLIFFMTAAFPSDYKMCPLRD